MDNNNGRMDFMKKLDRLEHSPNKRHFAFTESHPKSLITPDLSTTPRRASCIPLYPRENKPDFEGVFPTGIDLSPTPVSGAKRSPLGTGRVSVLDFGAVRRARKLGLRRRARTGAARGFARDSKVVQNLAYRFWLRDRRQDLRTALALWA